MCVHPDSKLRVFGKTCEIYNCRSRGATAHLFTLPNEAMRDVVDKKTDHLLVHAFMEDGNQAKPKPWQAGFQDAQAISSSTSRSSPDNAIGNNL